MSDIRGLEEKNTSYNEWTGLCFNFVVDQVLICILSISLTFFNNSHKILCGLIVETLMCGCQDQGSNLASD